LETQPKKKVLNKWDERRRRRRRLKKCIEVEPSE
jgi:hypothetical protein